MKKKLCFLLAVMMLAGCAKRTQAPAVSPATEPPEAQTIPAPEPTDPRTEIGELVGPWYLDSDRNNMTEMRVLFGTSMVSGSAMEIRSNGQISFSIGAGTGGAGSYRFDGQALDGTFVSYTGSREEAYTFSVVREGEKLWLAQEIYDTTVYWTQDAPVENAAGNIDAYAPVLDLYNKALHEKWNAEKCRNNQVNYLLGLGGSADTIGWCMRDVDGDGQAELFIGAVDSPNIYALYTLVNGAPKQIVDAGERSAWYLEPDGILVNQGSSSAFLSAMMFYWLRDGKLVLNNGLISDYQANENEPWFLTTDEDDSRANDTKISNAKAEELEKAYRTNFVTPDYTPFSQYAAG